MSYSSPTCAPKHLSKYLTPFEDQFLEKFDFDSETDNGDDISLVFNLDTKTKLVLSHIFTIPFKLTKKGLRRPKNWLKPLTEWRNLFLGKRVTRIDSETYKNDFYLEFDGEVALLTCKNLVTLYRDGKIFKTSMRQGRGKDER